jgi:uncharacterized membrane protein YdjX (TVP38/TMEM64 family)
MRPRRIHFAVGVGLLLVAAFLFAPDSNATWQAVRERLTAWQTFANENLLLSAAVFFLAYVVVTGLSLPSATAMSLLAGALFGRWLGTLLAVSAATVGATVAFLSARYLLRDWVKERFGPRLAAVERGVERDGATYLLTVRLMPVLPFFLVNLVMGLTPLRTRTFTWGSWLGMLPGAFVIVNVGTAAAKVESPREALSLELLLAVSLLGLLPFGAKWLLKRFGFVPSPLGGEG